jgi:hypothetical protein
MTRQWTLAESRLIAERVMEWQVTEHAGRLFFIHSDQRPGWLWDCGDGPTCAIPDWPRDPAAAAMALAAIQMEGWRIEGFWTAASHTFCVRLRHPITHATAEGNAREWSEAVMLAVLAAVEK